jgi:hypothetical protein
VWANSTFAAHNKLWGAGLRPNKDFPMSMDFQEMPALGTHAFEAIAAATASTAKGLQAIMAETTDYSRKSFENSRVLAEKLAGAKKIDEAIQLQTDFTKSAYEDFIAQATKIGNLYSDLAKEAFRLNFLAPARPRVSVLSKAPVAAKGR